MQAQSRFLTLSARGTVAAKCIQSQCRWQHIAPDYRDRAPGNLQAAAALLSQSSLRVHRQLEMLNVFAGWEQQNKYAIKDASNNEIGMIVETDRSPLVSTILRQVLRTRRPLTAEVLDNSGSHVLTLKRPTKWLLNSHIEVMDADQNVIGEVKQSWHLWRRRYDLFLDRRQFGRIDSGFLAWNFDVLDADGDVIANIDRSFGGLVREVFTDTGVYVVSMDGSKPDEVAEEPIVERQSGDGLLRVKKIRLGERRGLSLEERERRKTEALKRIRKIKALERERESSKKGSPADITDEKNEQIKRALSLEERAVMLACAVTIDVDFFSRHSGGGFMPTGAVVPLSGGVGAPVPIIIPGDFGGGHSGGGGGDATVQTPVEQGSSISNGGGDATVQTPVEQGSSISNGGDGNSGGNSSPWGDDEGFLTDEDAGIFSDDGGDNDGEGWF